MIDYWVATYSFCFYLDARLPGNPPLSRRFSTRMPPGAILYGDVEAPTPVRRPASASRFQ